MRPIIKTEKGGYVVPCENGDQVPAAVQFEDGLIRCPYHCRDESHRHGNSRSGAFLSHRVAECREDRDNRLGYFLLREKPPALMTVRAASDDRPANLGLGRGAEADAPTDRGDFDGPALLAGVL